jgi:hypothetical protein
MALGSSVRHRTHVVIHPRIMDEMRCRVDQVNYANAQTAWHEYPNVGRFIQPISKDSS